MRVTRRDIGKALAELTVIVVGVLLAFQVESWNAGRQDRLREQAQLAALDADFEENRRRLEGVIEAQRRTLSALGDVIRIARGEVSPPEPDSAARLIVRAHMFQRLEPVMGAYEALIASGDLRVISSDSLRSELASFAGAVGSGFEDEAMADDLHAQAARIVSRLVPFWLVLAELYGDPFEYSGDPESVDFGPVFRDQEYLGVLIIAGALEANQMGYFEALHARLLSIQALLGRERGL